MESIEIVRKQISASAHAKEALLQDDRILKQITYAAEVCTEAYRKGHKTLFAGNGGSAADAAYGMGKRAGELLSEAKLNIRIMDLKGAVSTALREVGEMIYATHTGTLTESEVLLAKLQEIDGLRQQIDRLEREIARLQGGAVCPFCGAAARSGDVFCRECGQKL